MARGAVLSPDRPMQVFRYRLNSMPVPGVKQREVLGRLDRPLSRSCREACLREEVLQPLSLKQLPKLKVTALRGPSYRTW